VCLSCVDLHIFIQGVSKRALQLWKSIQIYTKDIHNILNCHNVAKHYNFDPYSTAVPNTATGNAPAVEIAIFNGAERARCMFWFEEMKSATQAQRKFRTQNRKEPPSMRTIYSWHKNFGCSVRHTKSPGRPCVSDATVEQLRESFVRSPWKPMWRVSWETGIPNVTVWRVLQKRLHLKAYKLSIVQHLTNVDKVVHKAFRMQMIHQIQDDEGFLDSVIFNDESTFHVSIVKPFTKPGYLVGSWWRTPLRHPPKITIDQ
jgi:hypothetical protein